MKIKRDDKILVISGKDRGKTGKLLRVLPKNDRVVVENINLMKRAVRPSNKNKQGGIVEFPASIPVSNVQLVCSHCNKATRIGYRINKDAKGSKKYKERICKKCQGVID